jgi:hypothetical protein
MMSAGQPSGPIGTGPWMARIRWSISAHSMGATVVNGRNSSARYADDRSVVRHGTPNHLVMHS